MVSILLGEQRYFEETLPISELKELLDSGSMSTARGQADRIRGLKWLLAMISKGTDVSRFFPDVIRNIMTPNLELKKLVYMYVLHYADHDEASRSAALLSINAFQRDLSDEHELIRGLALRTLTSIRVDDIQAVQALAVRTCARDVSPYVRKLAANAVTKICLDMSKTNPNREQFEDEILGKLLIDSSPTVMGSAACAVLEVCPDRFDLMHAAFDRLLNVLTEVDEWGQIAILKLMGRYARSSFVNPVVHETPGEEENDGYNEDGVSSAMLGSTSSSRKLGDEDEVEDDESRNLALSKRKWQGVVLAPVIIPASSKRRLPTKSELDTFLNDSSSSSPALPEIETSRAKSLPMEISSTLVSHSKLPMHENHKRLLRSTLPLLKSRNSGVVMAASAVMWYCGQRSKNAMQRVAQAMVRLVRSPYREVRYCALRSVLPLICERPGPFTANLSDFFVNASLDAPFVRNLKLEIICRLVRDKTLGNVLRELEMYVIHPNENFAAQAVRTVGRIAIQSKPAVAHDCLIGLATLVAAEGCPKRVLEESVVVARDVFARLRSSLDADEIQTLQGFLALFERVPQSFVRARCSLVWLAREFRKHVPNEAGDILRSAASTFCEEGSEVKLQILSLASVYLIDEPALSAYVFEIGEFDSFFEVRDWARCLAKSNCDFQPLPEKLTATGIETLGQNDDLNGAVVSATKSSTGGGNGNALSIEFDSLSFVVERAIPGYSPLPEWSTQNRTHLRPNRASESSSTSSSSGDTSEEESSSSEEESDSDASEGSEANAESTEAMSRLSATPSHKGVNGKQATDDPLPRPHAPMVPPPALFKPEVIHARIAAFKPLISHVRGQGLQIDYWFSRERLSGDKNKTLTPVRLRISNRLDDRTLSKIRIVDSGGDQIVTPMFDTVESLGPGFCREDLDMLIAFQGHWRTSVKFTVSTEETGKIPVEIRAPPGELLFPDNSLTLDEFARLRKQLQGMNQTTLRLSNPHGHDVVKRVLDVCNFFPFPASDKPESLLTESLNFRFAGRRCDTAATRILLEISVGLDGFLDLALHCEYALAGQALMDDLKVAFESKDY